MNQQVIMDNLEDNLTLRTYECIFLFDFSSRTPEASAAKSGGCWLHRLHPRDGQKPLLNDASDLGP